MIKANFHETLYLKNDDTAMFYGYLALLLIEILLMIRLKKLFFKEPNSNDAIDYFKAIGACAVAPIFLALLLLRGWYGLKNLADIKSKDLRLKLLASKMRANTKTMIGLRLKFTTDKTRRLTP